MQTACFIVGEDVYGLRLDADNQRERDRQTDRQTHTHTHTHTHTKCAQASVEVEARVLHGGEKALFHHLLFRVNGKLDVVHAPVAEHVKVEASGMSEHTSTHQRSLASPQTHRHTDTQTHSHRRHARVDRRVCVIGGRVLHAFAHNRKVRVKVPQAARWQ